MRFSPRHLSLICAATASSLVMSGTVCVTASAESSLSSLSSSRSAPKTFTPVKPPEKRASEPVTMPDGTTVQIMDDLLGRYSAHTGFREGDLGIMAPLTNSDEFALVFGDSFRTSITKGKHQWLSPVGVVAKRNEDGFIEIVRPLNAGERVENLVTYYRADNLTLIPSDVINIDGTLYMQGMWNQGIGNVLRTQIWKSTNNGKTWQSVAVTGADYIDGMGDLLTWEKGQDGYIYVMSTKFKREDSVFLSRFKPEDIGDRYKWELYNASTGEWGNVASPILDSGVQAGEMNLRYIDGHWVLVMFNRKTLAIEVRISDTLVQNWNDVPVATVAKNGPWSREQTPENWSQPYGGYIVPGSHIDDMDIVVSQWNTATDERYMSTQFNVKGLDKFFGIDMDTAYQEPEAIVVEEFDAGDDTPDMQAEDSLLSSSSEVFLSSEDHSALRTAGIVLGVLAALGAAGALAFPLIRDYIPEPVVNMLPSQVRQMLQI